MDTHDDNEIHIGASGTMSPILNAAHELLSIDSESKMVDILISSRKYLYKPNRDIINKSHKFGLLLTNDMSHQEKILYNKCVDSFSDIRNAHVKVSARAINASSGKDYKSTALTTNKENIKETINSLKILRDDTLKSKLDVV